MLVWCICLASVADGLVAATGAAGLDGELLALRGKGEVNDSLDDSAMQGELRALRAKYAPIQATETDARAAAAAAALAEACPPRDRKRAAATREVILRDGARACGRAGGRGDASGFSDLWCIDVWDQTDYGVRSFGHPQGMCYAGFDGSFVYLPIPKVATTTGRAWARGAYDDAQRAASHLPRAAPWLIPTGSKPIADRNAGAAVYRSLPRAVRHSAVQFAFLRDPAARFASGWREILAYERGPTDARRAWGRRVIRQRPFYANATAAHFGGGDGSGKGARGRLARPAARDRALGSAVRDLACDLDWNEHLTPQANFLPVEFLSSPFSFVIPQERIDATLPTLARLANLSRASTSFAAGDREDRKGAGPGRSNARGGWPQAEDLRGSMDRFDAEANGASRGASHDRPPTRWLWCWAHSKDYALLRAGPRRIGKPGPPKRVASSIKGPFEAQ
ncbi:hypothetical protein M885DRAFT_524068 [Pelagophyceae sp. CCMP2097]|nr:hypothetical protein M885DRAFT_524068 [Pelagophyceae sp. CCMP2097]